MLTRDMFRRLWGLPGSGLPVGSLDNLNSEYSVSKCSDQVPRVCLAPWKPEDTFYLI